MCGDVEPCPGPITQQNCSRIIPELNSLLQKRGLKILHQNAKGLSTNMAYVSEIFKSFRGIDIVGISETHVNHKRDEMPPSLFDIPGYSFVSRPLPDGKGGGVAAYISESLKWDRKEDLEMEEFEVIWLEVTPKKSRGFLVAIDYHQPDTSKYLNKDFEHILSRMLTKTSDESKETIFLGDMNANYLVPEDNKKFKSTFDLFGFKQAVLKPTRITTTL